MNETQIYLAVFLAVLTMGLHSNMDRNQIGNAAQIRVSGPAVFLLMLMVPVNLASTLGPMAVAVWSMWKLSFGYSLLAVASSFVALFILGFPLHRSVYPKFNGPDGREHFPIAVGLNLLTKAVSVGSAAVVAYNLWEM